jgi:hypothetical protein
MSKLYLAFICTFYLFLGISSAIVEISDIQKASPQKKTIKIDPELVLDNNDVFMVLDCSVNRSLSTYGDNDIKNTENALIQSGLKVITDNKAKYLLSNKKLDYFVVIERYYVEIKEQERTEGCYPHQRSKFEESNFYYYIVSAKDLELKYISSFQTFDIKEINAPFSPKELIFNTDQCKYFNTFYQLEYNSDVANSTDLKIKELSKELLNNNFTEQQINIDKKKKQDKLNDKYIILVNLATSQLLTEDYDGFESTVKNIADIRNSVSIKDNYSLKDKYLEFLKDEKSKILTYSIKQVNRASALNEGSKTYFYFQPIKEFDSDFQRMCLMNALVKIKENDFDANGTFAIKVDMYSIVKRNLFTSSGWHPDEFEPLRNLLSPNSYGLYYFRINTEQIDIFYPLRCSSSGSKNNISVTLNLKISKANDGTLIGATDLKYVNTNPTTLTTLPFRLDDMISTEILNDKFKTLIRNTKY